MNNKIGISFANEIDKVDEMKKMSKNDFLKEYSYLNSEDYFATCKNLFCGKNSNFF